MKAAIWTRVSTDEQETANQLDVLRDWATRRGFDVVKVYEPKESAFTNGKLTAALNAVLEDARQGEFEILLVWALDRLTRKGALDTLQTVENFARVGVTISSHEESWVEATGDFRDVMLAIVGWMAKMESARKSERVKAALARRRREGLPVGRQPGATDAKPRKRSGYYARWERERALKA